MLSSPHQPRRSAALLIAALVGFAIWALTLWGGPPSPVPVAPFAPLAGTPAVVPHTTGDGAGAAATNLPATCESAAALTPTGSTGGVSALGPVTPPATGSSAATEKVPAPTEAASAGAASAVPSVVDTSVADPNDTALNATFTGQTPAPIATAAANAPTTPLAAPDPPAVDITALAAAGAGDAAAEPSEAAIDEAFERKLAGALRQYRTMGAVVCVFQYGRVTDIFTYGQLDPEGSPVTADTMFRVGSISKMVAALGVMRLVQDGRATLDGDISDLLGTAVRNPAYPDVPITLRQIMTHTAGLRDSGPYTLALRGRVASLAELFAPPLARFQFEEGYAPGARASYTNLGGGLLGSVIEQVTGQTVDAYMQQAVFGPLGITAAFQAALLPQGATVSDLYQMPGRRRTATVRDGTPAYTAPDAATHYTLTAGKLVISAPDLCRILIALCDDGVYGGTRLLDEPYVRMMRETQNSIGSVTGNSGRGLSLNILDGGLVGGHTLYGHGGKANGMLCAAYFDPAGHTGVVMLTNGCNNRPVLEDVGKLSVMVLRLVYGELLAPRSAYRSPWLVME